MKIKELLKDIEYTIVQGTDDLEIDNIAWDSRRINANSLFICTSGKNVDRHAYAAEAVSKGAAALLIQHDLYCLPERVTAIKTKDTRLAMAYIANRFYGEPSKKFNLIGVTGTNGKTSVCYFIEKILEELGRKVGVIGTIENKFCGNQLKTLKLNPTTPDSIELQSSFKEMADQGATDVIMEVTSSALDKQRVNASDFDIGIFTNLSQDHLDEHGTMENYKNAKKKLFKMCRLGIINGDDAIAQEIIDYADCDIITIGINNNADLMAKNIQYDSTGTVFTLDFHSTEKEVRLRLPGVFNVYNALSAISTCYFLGFPLDIIISALSCLEGVPGRYESIENNAGVSAIIDYAHTPEGLKSIVQSLRHITSGRIITLFGCGGDRDRSKRPMMGEIAGHFSDYCIITSDNPRSENPEAIIKEIEEGVKRTESQYRCITNRKEAVLYALEMAEPGDTVLIAGKGHENYQIIGDEIRPFSDKVIIQDFFCKNNREALV